MLKPFPAAEWLPGAHLQTVWPLLLRQTSSHLALPHYRRERLATPDGDFLDLDWLVWGSDCSEVNAPLLVLFHGLEGSSASHYARAMMHALSARHWRGVVVHFRGCSGMPNQRPRAYHSGDSAEIDWVLKHLHQTHGNAPLFAYGVSLGGNALLKWLGEQGVAAQSIVAGAAAMSVPYDLSAANDNLSHGVGRLYARHFLGSLIPRTLAKAEQFPDHPVLRQTRRISAARTLREFDDAVTAPLHGFIDAADYYAQSSSAQYLHGIQVKSLLLHARNDPFLPPKAIPLPQQLSTAVKLHISATGGHAGFVSGKFPGHLRWPAEEILEYFAALI